MLIFFLLSNVIVSSGEVHYDLKCPHVSQWKQREYTLCNRTHASYFCLFDENEKRVKDFCERKPEIQRPGYKFVISGNLHGIPCNGDRFQPFKFSTNGSNECVLHKSSCNDEGQIPYDRGNATTDMSCQCDYERGYAFVKHPKHRCYCVPFFEDCSCYLKKCSDDHVLTPDFECVALSMYINVLADHYNCSKSSIVDTDSKVPMFTKEKTCVLNEQTEKGVGKKKVMLLHLFYLVVIVLLIVAGLIVFISFIPYSVMMVDRKVQHKEDDFRRRLQKHMYDICTTVKSDVIDFLRDEEVLSEAEAVDIRNHGMRTKDTNHRLLQILWKKEPKDYKSFLVALERNDAYKSLARAIQANDESLTEERIEENIADDYNDNIPGYNRELNLSYIKKWFSEDASFVYTPIAEKAEEKLKNSSCLMFVGRTDEGKTSTIRHLALKLWKEEGFDIIPIVLVPLIIKKFHNEKRKQVFVVDDFCGVHKLHETSLDLWVLPTYTDMIETMTSKNNKLYKEVKILIACNLDIFNDERFDSLKYYRKFVFMMQHFKISDDTRKMLMKKKFKPATEHNAKDLPFPLLCNISKVIIHDKLEKFFKNPIKSIRRHFLMMSERMDIEFYILTLTALLNGKLEEQWLFNKSFTGVDKIVAISQKFKLDLNSGEIQKRIKNALSNLEDNYLSKNGDIYQFVHPEIKQIANAVCGHTFFKTFLKFASSNFIGDMYTLNDTKDLDGLIGISEEREKQYFNRICKDLMKGDTYSFLHNAQLESKEYRTKLMVYCGQNKQQISNALSSLKENDSSYTCKDVRSSLFGNHDPVDNTVYLKLKTNRNFNEINIGSPLVECVIEGHVDIVQFLLDCGCSVNESNVFGRSALYIASLLGMTDIVKLLCNRNADIFIKDHKGRSPLHVACREGNIDVVEYIICTLKKSMEVFKGDSDGCSPLHAATEGNCEGVVKFLLEKKANVNAADKMQRTPLYIAAEDGHAEIVKTLLKYKADTEIGNTNGWTPLFAAAKGKKQSIVKLLLESQRSKCQDDIKYYDNEGMTPLMFASSDGCVEVVKELLNYNPDLNMRNKNGRTALSMACGNGKDEIVKLLLEKGCSLNMTDISQKSALHYACKDGNVKCTQLLLEKDVDIRCQDDNGRTPLHHCCIENNFESAELILTKYPQCNLDKDFQLEYPLHTACEKSDERLVSLLLINGADQCINLKNKNGRVPLHIACVDEKYKLVNLLLKWKCNVEPKDKFGETPLDLARKMEHTQIVPLLLEHL